MVAKGWLYFDYYQTLISMNNLLVYEHDTFSFMLKVTFLFGSKFGEGYRVIVSASFSKNKIF